MLTFFSSAFFLSAASLSAFSFAARFSSSLRKAAAFSSGVGCASSGYRIRVCGQLESHQDADKQSGGP